MKIIYCSAYFDPAVPSGANRRFVELISRFDREFGSNFELIVAKGKRPQGLTGTILHEIAYKPKSLISKWQARDQIAAILKQSPPAIFVNEFIPAPFSALEQHIQFQVVYDLRDFTDNQTLFYRLKYTLPLKREWRKAQYLVTCSDFTRSEIFKYLNRKPEDILISYFGIDPVLLAYELPQSVEKDIDILFVGHFEKRKNHANLLKAAALIDPKLRMTLIGVDNGLKQSLQALSKELRMTNVEMFTVGGEKLWEYYKRAKLFVFPSHYEGFGIPLIEALALNVPVVCSDIPVFREIGGQLVRYFDQTNPADMARVIGESLKKPYLPPKNEIVKALTPFVWDSIYRKFVDDLLVVSRLLWKKGKAYSLGMPKQNLAHAVSQAEEEYAYGRKP
jgi:glycosyltransferase involved in cell wall biosynthesis